MALSPTKTLEIRAQSSSSSSSSSTSSYDCNGKDKNSNVCQKPTNENGLEIGLGVGIPVALILLVLSYFLYKNYRKDQKELLEHDPDFDENGDATALPDFPAFTKDDPFANRNSVNPFAHNGGYPMMTLPNKSANELQSMLTRGLDDRYVDGFVLPYHHQMGSKASLDEYAKQIINQNVTHNRGNSVYRASSVYSRPFSTQPESTRASPQRSSLRKDVDTPYNKGPVRKLVADDYTSLNNNSTALFGTEFYNTKEQFDNESGDTSGETTKASTQGNQFDVKYENELNPVINSTLNQLPKSPEREHGKSPDSDGVESVEDDESDEEDRGAEPTGSNKQPSDVANDSDDGTAPTVPSFSVQSPFEDKHEFESSYDTTADEIRLPDRKSPAKQLDGDINFSNDLDDELLASPNRSLGSGDREGMKKSPRMSAFNMLKNVSDEEDDEVSLESVKMTDDQEEELARMKSVYKVYFDRANSMKSTKGDDPNGHSFQADPSQPLPTLDVDRLKINDQLRGDTNYHKRETTTSSIYAENPIYGDTGDRTVIHPHQQFNAQPYEYAQNQYYAQQHYAQQQYAQQGVHYEQQPSEHFEPPRVLAPLKSLPHASDIRHSTIETFTEYQPRAKISSPSLRNQHNYFEGADLTSSPYMSSQGSFASPTPPDMGELPPMIRKGSGSAANPSPSQLARTSVVMLNPVNEITSLRTFKPAGSLPSGVAPASYFQGTDELANSNEELIPGNRKSAVRRMMNTNF